MKNVLLITSTIGIYAVLCQVWTWLEKIELGTAQISFVDTVICLIISALISSFLMEWVLERRCDMTEQNKVKTFFINISRKLFGIKETPKEVSDENKREMCRRALQSGVCHHDCDVCAWNTLR